LGAASSGGGPHHKCALKRATFDSAEKRAIGLFARGNWFAAEACWRRALHLVMRRLRRRPLSTQRRFSIF
jgi:hypothetical protein